MFQVSAAQNAAVVLLASIILCTGCHAAARAPIPAARSDAPLAQAPGRQIAVFAGGCFWGTQSVFERVKGVLATTAGYAGGSASTATYAQVTTETTGHAESVRVVYDPSKITYGQLLRIFFSVVHDPTQLNRQGPDVGTSYRSAIFFTSQEQRRISLAYIAQLDAARVFPKRIVTEVAPLKGFYEAELYHRITRFTIPEILISRSATALKSRRSSSSFPSCFRTIRANDCASRYSPQQCAPLLPGIRGQSR